VVDAQDLALAQQPVQPGIQLASRRQVVAERLLDCDPAVAQQLRRAELLHDKAEQGQCAFWAARNDISATARPPDSSGGRARLHRTTREVAREQHGCDATRHPALSPVATNY
jgi:hypothetical protein